MSIRRDSLYNLIGTGVASVVGLFAVPLYLHLVGAERYGFLAVAWALLGSVGFLDFGLTRATAYHSAAHRPGSAEARETFWAASLGGGMVALIGFFVLWGLGSLAFGRMEMTTEVAAEAARSPVFLAAIWPALVFTGVWGGVAQGHGYFGTYNIFSVLSSILFQLLPLLCAAIIGASLPILIAAGVVGRAIPLIFLFLSLASRLRLLESVKLGASSFRPLLSYGGWVTVSSAGAAAIGAADRVVIGSVLGPLAVAVYQIPLQIAQRFSLLSTAVMSAAFPRLARAGAEQEAFLALRAAQIVLVLQTAFIVTAIALVSPILDLWVGRRMADLATAPGLVLLVGGWWAAVAVVPYLRLQATGSPRTVALIILIEILPYLLGFWLAASFVGTVTACAIVWMLRSVFDCLLLFRAATVARMEAALVREILFCALLVTGAAGLAAYIDSADAPVAALIAQATLVGTAGLRALRAVVLLRRGSGERTVAA